jgi:hypothetical protein
MKQITKNTDTNWNIYQDEKGYFYSKAIKEGCQDTFFCSNINYIIGLIYNYKSFKKEDFTEYGYSLILNYLNEMKFTEEQLFKGNKQFAIL